MNRRPARGSLSLVAAAAQADKSLPTWPAPGATPNRTPAADRVLEAAVHCFSEAGFLATTVRDITKACGLTPAAIYNHFESKELILYTIVSETMAHLELDLAQLEVAKEPDRHLADLVRCLVRVSLTRRREAAIANSDYVYLMPPLLDEVVAHRQRVREMFEHALRSADARIGPLLDAVGRDAEIRLLANSIMNLSMASGDWYRSRGKLSVEKVGDICAVLALRLAGLEPDDS